MPDNIAYLQLGLAVVMGFMGVYVMSLALRFRQVYRDKDLIQSFRDE